ncbi:MAG: cytochrome c3 family protein [Flavobacteriaceae bacterium]|jgi:mono/diheme cytochrome c family protein|nr:c-type cytochrome [Flavobacteriaceae bacterium]MDG1790272.1 cytochrome c3 family protein [Flavobacteriaceae bacterium]MDG2447601.1 cytochrome c3 family protein [Flavobacteriaceae bacterium]
MKKVNYKNLSSKLSFLLLVFLLAFSTNTLAQEEGDVKAGEALYKSNCAACHKLDKKGVGPALRNVAEKYERDWLYKWISNSQGLIKSGDSKAVALFAEYNNSVMTSFPGLSNTDIDNILAYTSLPKPEPKIAVAPVTASNNDDGNLQNIILAVLVLILLLLVTMFYLVAKSLTKLSQANGVEEKTESKKPLWKVFVQNQFLMLVSAILFLLVAAYFMFGFFMQIGIDQGYAPVQPIHYSHKIHAGANKIDCKYCHSSARVSKKSGIPSLNVCMNCHKNISEYNGEEDLANGYTKEFYTKEIAKLYDAVGWDDADQSYTGEEKPVKWIQIHNLPDFVYFNHSQHVNVAGVECQTCHGPVEEMEIMYQHSPLTMGWCIDCHRETNVDLENNDYYEKIHEELSKKYNVEKLTAAELGGLECGKCHY